MTWPYEEKNEIEIACGSSAKRDGKSVAPYIRQQQYRKLADRHRSRLPAAEFSLIAVDQRPRFIYIEVSHLPALRAAFMA